MALQFGLLNLFENPVGVSEHDVVKRTFHGKYYKLDDVNVRPKPIQKPSIPISVNETRYETFSYYPEPKTASERFNREYGFCHFRGVISEDIYNMEFSQTAMESGAIKSLLLQEGEICIRHQLAEVDRIIHDNMTSKD